MQTIIFIHNVQAAGTLQPVHGEKMHRFIIHAHQLCQAGRLLGSDVIGMKLRTQGSETSILQIEVISGMIILQVGIQTEKTGKAHQEDQMEIGKPLPAFIQPDDGMIQISKQRTVLCLLPDGAIKEFRKKQSDGRFVGIVGKRGERIKRLRSFTLYIVALGRKSASSSTNASGWKSTGFTAALRERGMDTMKEALPATSV